MLLSKAIHLTDSVTESVTARLPAPLATPVHVAVSALTWAPRRVVDGVEHVTGHHGPAAGTGEQATGTTQDPASSTAPDRADEADRGEPHEPEVVLTLDRPADEVDPPVDVVGEALRTEQGEQAGRAPQSSDLDEEGHVEVEEEVVYSTSTDTD